MSYRSRRVHLVVVLAVLAVALSGCGPKYDIKTNPVGAVAFHADQVTQINGHVAQAVMAAETAKLISTEKAAAALRTCKAIDVKAVELAAALTELDKLPLTDLNRQPKIQAISAILEAMNVLIFQVVIPLNDDPLRVQISTLLTQISQTLLAVAAQLH